MTNNTWVMFLLQTECMFSVTIMKITLMYIVAGSFLHQAQHLVHLPSGTSCCKHVRAYVGTAHESTPQFAACEFCLLSYILIIKSVSLFLQ